jgi:integrative and conjugative element protein (TIGR02256 family)
MTAEPPLPTSGQHQALSELTAAGRAIDAVVHVRDVSPHGSLRVDVEIDCHGVTSERADAALADRELVSILIPARYPLQPPVVHFPHRRFAGLPHVVWGEYLCLYVTQNEWDPGLGMTDLVVRLLTWLGHVGAGTVSGPEVPWEPPITNLSLSPGRLLVRAELPPALERDDSLWVGSAVIEATGRAKYEVRDWLDSWPATGGGRTFVAPVVGLPGPAGFSYPDDLGELLAGLRGQGLEPKICGQLAESTLIRSAAAASAAEPGETPPSLILLGSRARRDSPLRGRVAHFAAWWVTPALVARAVAWMRVEDQRPSVTTRRDHRRPAQWLLGKRVLLLGCGALGAPLAEFCVRGGARAVRLVDSGYVHYGLLVRQPYSYGDLGRPKAEVLGERLGHVMPVSEGAGDAGVEGLVADAVELVQDDAGLLEADLVIDATANRAVATALELAWRGGPDRPPLLSVMVGHECDLGVGTLALPGSGVAGLDVLRQLLLTATEDDGLRDVLDDLLPDPPRTDLFQPEPGCSDPTFAGSAADLAGLAGLLFNDALVLLAERPPKDVLVPQRWATVARSPGGDSPGAPSRRLQWLNDVRLDEAGGHGYQIRMAPQAFADLRQEVLRAVETSGPARETGGLLLGRIDRASKVVWVSEASGLPPGSTAWVEGLRLDPATQREHTAQRRRDTRGLVGYIGTWHSHPELQARPSPIDLTTMEQIVHDDGPVVLLIVGGDPECWNRWLAGGGRPETHAELFFPGRNDAPEETHGRSV